VMPQNPTTALTDTLPGMLTADSAHTAADSSETEGEAS